MNIYPELKQIAMANAKRNRLAEKVTARLDVDGLDLSSAYIINGCSEKDGHLYQNGVRLDNSGLVDDDYYCRQYAGYCGDDFYGTLYFKTNGPGQFVAIPFQM